jgi:homoserine O-acetyltransferase/O-succinyltransferase
MRRVKGGRYVVQQGSAQSYGHLTMVHPALWAEHVREFVDWSEGR